jgi:hypothetical protein
MITSKGKLKILEYKFIEEELKKSSELVTSTFIGQNLYINKKYRNKKEIDYGIIFKTLITNENNFNHILVYKSEFISKLTLESNHFDLYDIKELLVKKSFINHQKFYKENKPEDLNISDLMYDTKVDSLSDNILFHLKSMNLYD